MYLMYSVVIIGFDKNNFYINDLYGYKNCVVKRSVFEEGWFVMGK